MVLTRGDSFTSNNSDTNQVTDLGVNHGALKLPPLLTKAQSQLFQIGTQWDTIFFAHAAHTERLLGEMRLFKSSGLIYNVGVTDNTNNKKGWYDYRLCDWGEFIQ